MSDITDRPTLDLAAQVAVDAGSVALRDTAPTPAHVEQSMDDFIAMALRDPSIDVTKLDALLRMKRQAIADLAEAEFYEALHAAQAEIPQVERLGTVSLGEKKGSYAFARWEDMDRVLRPIMDRHGFTLDFDMEQRPGDGGGAKVIAALTHTAEGRKHTITRSVSLPLDAGAGRNNLQAMGSTISYAKRYLAEMLFNIVRKSQDDDGNLGGTKFVTAEDAEHIRLLLRDTKTDETAFLHNFFEVNAVENLSEQSAIAAKNMLLSKQRAMQKPKEPQ
jgi:ERF superfamily